MSEKDDVRHPPLERDAQDEDEEHMRIYCPKCHSTDIRRARISGFWSTLSSFVGRLPYRCRSCRIKFYRFSSGRDD